MEFDTIKALELELSDSSVRGDIKRLSQLLADDFEEVGKSGRRYNKQQIIDALQQEQEVDFTVSDFRFVALANDSVLVKYITSIAGEKAFRSSIWVKTNNQWLLKYHQGTVAHS